MSKPELKIFYLYLVLGHPLVNEFLCVPMYRLYQGLLQDDTPREEKVSFFSC